MHIVQVNFIFNIVQRRSLQYYIELIWQIVYFFLFARSMRNVTHAPRAAKRRAINFAFLKSAVSVCGNKTYLKANGKTTATALISFDFW